MPYNETKTQLTPNITHKLKKINFLVTHFNVLDKLIVHNIYPNIINVINSRAKYAARMGKIKMHTKFAGNFYEAQWRVLVNTVTNLRVP